MADTHHISPQSKNDKQQKQNNRCDNQWLHGNQAMARGTELLACKLQRATKHAWYTHPYYYISKFLPCLDP
jgi:hypothetical protein